MVSLVIEFSRFHDRGLLTAVTNRLELVCSYFRRTYMGLVDSRTSQMERTLIHPPRRALS